MSDPNTIYVSKRHYERKKRVEQRHKDRMKDTMEDSGILSLILLYVWDMFVEIVIGFIFDLFDIMFFSFDYTQNFIFGNYRGIFPDSEKYGLMFSYKYIRYILTVLVPPVGVLMSKGLFGWFNILICMLLCYVHYVLGIIYAFVICVDSRYSDRYERRDIARIKKERAESGAEKQTFESTYPLISTIMFILLFFGILGYLLFRF